MVVVHPAAAVGRGAEAFQNVMIMISSPVIRAEACSLQRGRPNDG